MPTMSFDDVLHRARGEFLEMPGLRLTVTQARKLWNLDAPLCESLLSSLVEARFLVRLHDGAFVRADR
ncbi:MAG TPA: hypothetical protein VH702_02875 [Vicinamibacterales bacterium]